MQVTSVDVGDCYVHRCGNRVVVTKIWCEFSPADNRWETSIAYDQLTVGDALAHKCIEKARHFVLMVTNDDYTKKISAAPEQGGASTSIDAVYTPSSDPQRREMEEEFLKHAAKLGLSPSDLGKTIKVGSNKTKYQIIGARPRNRKHPILIEGARGGVYKLSVDKVKEGMRAALKV